MKILIYAHSFPPSKGGLQYSNLEIVKGLEHLGHDIRLITCFNEGIRKFISNFSFPVRILPRWNFTTMYSVSREGLLNWILAPWYLFIILKEIYNFKPDVGFITDESANAFWGVISRIVQIPYVSYCSVPVFRREELFSNYKLIRIILKAIMNKIIKRLLCSYKRANKIIVVSQSTRQQFFCEMPELLSKIDIIPRSVNDEFFQAQINEKEINRKKKEFGIKKNSTVLLSISRLTANKGIDDVINAIHNLEEAKKKDIKYLILGSGHYGQYLKGMVADLKLENNVIFHEEVDHLDLIPFYDMSDIFVLPSRRGISESFGRVFAEAAARGKASIGVNEGGMTDIIENGKTGFLIQPSDIDALKSNIDYVIEHKSETKNFGINARIKAVKNYDCITNAKKFEKHLKEAMMEFRFKN